MFPVSTYQLPGRIKMTINEISVLIFIGLFVLTGIIICTDDATNKKIDRV